MSKLTEAQALLAALDMPRAQQTEIAALTLLVLAQLDEATPWQLAVRRSLRIHDILQEMQTRFGRTYAENTRETVRRQVIHQFEQARLIDRNPDDPTLPTNSPRTHYALTEFALRTLRAYQSAEWEAARAAFLEAQPGLSTLYARRRRRQLVALRYAGQTIMLSPGAHNRLQVAIVEQFGPHFAPGASLLYLGDAADKMRYVDVARCEQLAIPLTAHDKLPDVMLYAADRNWLFLIEAVSSHGPVTAKRRVELAALLADCPAGLVFVSAFADLASFRRFVADIAWETEVWIAERPDHLIHFDGERFLGP